MKSKLTWALAACVILGAIALCVAQTQTDPQKTAPKRKSFAGFGMREEPPAPDPSTELH